MSRLPSKLMQGVIEAGRGIFTRLQQLDAQIAARTLEDFEAWSGGPADRPLAVRAALEEVVRAARPEGRMLLLHHWATWCAPCATELPEVARLVSRVLGHVDVVIVGWERFSDEGPFEASLARVGEAARTAGLSWSTLVVDCTPEALFDALALADTTVPQTTLLDVDGAVLGHWTSALTAADVATIEAIALGRTP